MASEKIVKFVEEIKTLTVLELADLVKAIEEEFGVSAAAPVMVAGPAAGAPPPGTPAESTAGVAGLCPLGSSTFPDLCRAGPALRTP